MSNSSDNYSNLFISLSEAIDTFINEVKKHNLSDMATEKWTIKDELCHIAFWHSYYAQNYSALASGTKPFLFVSKGGSTRNQEGVDKLSNKSQNFLVTLLRKSQDSLYKSIVVKKVPRMTYIVGREYKTKKFLELIIGHIQRHTILVRRAKKTNK